MGADILSVVNSTVMDKEKYEANQKEKFLKFEAICKRCGACCGSEDTEPCINLAREAKTGTYYCKDYENRIGLQKTASGKPFHCIPIRELIAHNLLRPNCAYRNS